MSFVYAFDCHPSLVNIKEEANDVSHSLISPPTTPSPPFHPLPTATTASRRRGSTTSLPNTKRHRPYTVPARHIISRSTEDAMSTTAYASWPTTSPRSGHARQQSDARRSSDREEQNFLSSQFLNGAYMGIGEASSTLGTSSSSLSGAMGDTNLAPHSRISRSPESSNSGHIYTGGVASHDSLGWHPSQVTIAMDPSQYPAMPGHNSLSFQDLSPLPQMNAVDMNDFTTMPRRVSPSSPHSGGSISPYGVAGPSLALPSQLPEEALVYSSLGTYTPSGNEDEVRRLRRKVRELEETIKQMRSAGSSVPSNRSPELQAAWKARTAARKRVFCSLNRAGNALCAWHDSRRERRKYAPRNAPAGYLNCGCTHEQALFEESLSRHGVGSYHPGESVRMDPALRNPLLELLQKRFGYKDGDFELDPASQTWSEGESPAAWEQRAQAGAGARRRPEPEHH